MGKLTTNNLIEAKCNICQCEKVCKYRPYFAEWIETIMDTQLRTQNDVTGTPQFCKLRDFPYIEIELSCPYYHL